MRRRNDIVSCVRTVEIDIYEIENYVLITMFSKMVMYVIITSLSSMYSINIITIGNSLSKVKQHPQSCYLRNP